MTTIKIEMVVKVEDFIEHFEERFNDGLIAFSIKTKANIEECKLEELDIEEDEYDEVEE